MFFERAEAAFDEIALFVELAVVRDGLDAVDFGRDDGTHALLSHKGTDGIGVVALVGDNALGFLALQERDGLLAVGLFPSGEQEAQGASQAIAKQVDFGGQSATGSPQSLLTRPLFPVAADWWALTRVESIMR